MSDPDADRRQAIAQFRYGLTPQTITPAASSALWLYEHETQP